MSSAGSSTQKDDIYIYTPSGKHTKNYGTSPCLMGSSTMSLAIFQFAFCMFTRPGRFWTMAIFHYIPLSSLSEILGQFNRYIRGERSHVKRLLQWTTKYPVYRAPQLLLYPILLLGLVVIYPMISLRWLVINSYLLVSFTVRKYPTYCPRFCPPVIKHANGKSSICKWFAHWSLYPSIMWLGNSK